MISGIVRHFTDKISQEDGQNNSSSHLLGLGVRKTFLVIPEKWDDSQVGFQGSNASGGHIVLLPSAFWVHGASKMATLGASL